MCYSDGGSHAMVQICPTDREYLLDCNTDDYYSTYPNSGSWLAGHWNAANSQFLIGGGNGTTGGQAGSPTTLGATVLVNNPAVPGLATQVQVTPALPTGDAVASIAWSSARKDCTFADRAAAVTQVVCNATSSTGTSVTVTVTDTAGAVKAVTSPLTFSADGAKRDVTLVAGLRDQSGAAQLACTGASTLLTSTATDTATGLPIKGVAVKFTTQTGTALPVTVSSAVSDTSGTAGGKFIAQPTTLAASTTAVGAFDTGVAAHVTVSTHTCTTALTATLDPASSYYADPVVVSGVVTRDSGLPLYNATVSITELTTAGKVVSLGSGRSLADGSYRVTVKPTVSGTLRAGVAATTGWIAATATAAALTVSIPDTVFTASKDTGNVGYGSPVTVTGTLARSAGGVVTPLSGTVKITLTAGSSAPVVVGTGSASNGAWRIAAKPLASGTLTALYAGVTGQPAARVDLGQVTVGTWSASITLAAKYSTQPASTSNTLSGTVTRSYNGSTGPAPSVAVKLYLLPSSGTSPVLLKQVTTSSSGTYSGTVFPTVSGTLVAKIAGTTGYDDASSPGVPLLVQ